MFCQKCGKEIENDTKFCPYCGNQIAITPRPQQIKKDDLVQQKPEKKKKKKGWLIGAIAVVIIIIAGLVIFSDDGPSGEELVDLVQNGYLGNYDTVAIKEVLEYASKDGEWKAYETADGDHYVVEFSGEDIRVQFSIDGLAAETFRLSGIEAEGIDLSEMEAYDVKVYIDDLYGLFAKEYPQKGLYIDKSVSNDTLEGHVGPIKSVEESDADENGSVTGLLYGKDDEESLIQDDIDDGIDFDLNNQSWETDYSQWEDIYQRKYGPSSTVWLSSIDDEGITFTAGIGASGYTAYVDIRDYFAEWIDEYTACYTEGFNYVLYITLNDDGSISLEDTQPYAGNLSLLGIYTRESEAEYPDCEFVFPNSANDYIAYEECEGLSELECKIARNEIYARHGRIFTDESLQGYFDACTWYEGTIEAGDFSESVLNDYELENLKTITDYEKQMGYR